MNDKVVYKNIIDPTKGFHYFKKIYKQHRNGSSIGYALVRVSKCHYPVTVCINPSQLSKHVCLKDGSSIASSLIDSSKMNPYECMGLIEKVTTAIQLHCGNIQNVGKDKTFIDIKDRIMLIPYESAKQKLHSQLSDRAMYIKLYRKLDALVMVLTYLRSQHV